MYGPKWPFLLRYGSRDMRRIDFSRVNGLSTDPPVLGRHKARVLFSYLSLFKSPLLSCLITKEQEVGRNPT